jgi:hypothetical protein
MLQKLQATEHPLFFFQVPNLGLLDKMGRFETGCETCIEKKL